MSDEERLREAIKEHKALRDTEEKSHKETRALLEGLEAVQGARDSAAALHALLLLIARTLHANHAIVLRRSIEGGQQVAFSSIPAFEGQYWDGQKALGRRGRHIIDLETFWEPGHPRQPVPTLGCHGMLSQPVPLGSGETAHLLCLSETVGGFSREDAALLERFGGVVAQALNGRDMEQRNALLAGVIEGSSASIAIYEVAAGNALTLTYVNDAFERLNGQSRKTILGSGLEVFTSAGDTSNAMRDLRQAVADHDDTPLVLENRDRSGRGFWNRLMLNPITDGTGVVRHMVITQVDVTRQVAAERDRDAARQRLEAALSSTGEGFLALGPDGTVLFANSRFEEFAGLYGIKWGAGSQFTETAAHFLVKQGVDPKIAVDEARKYLQHLMTEARTLELRLPDGRVVLVNERPIEAGEGGAVIVVADISALKTAEQSLTQRAAAIEAVQDGIAIADADGCITYGNPSLAALWQLDTPADLLGHHWMAFYPEGEAARLVAQLATTAGTGTCHQELHTVDDTVHNVSLTRVEDLGHVLTVRDITARLRAERERASLHERLHTAKRQEAIGQMAAGLAHDFNNLLSAITGSATLIAEDEDLPEIARTSADRIVAAGFRAAGLVNKLLDLGQQEQERERLDLKALLTEALSIAQSAMPADVKVTSDLCDGQVMVNVSASEVLQLFLNLLINARDALPRGGGTIKLSLQRDPDLPDVSALQLGRFESDAPYVSIMVEDSGCGIPADKIDKIFKPYFSSKGDKGTGLGLAVVASVVQANGCGLLVRSGEGVGTTFVVYWPLYDSSASKAQAPDDQLDVDLKGVTILVVDDDLAVAEMIARLLEQHGAEVSAVDDPEMALETVMDDPGLWGCLVTDYNMPGMTGGELIEQIGQLAPNLPRVVVTALARTLNDTRLNSRSVDAILSKPVDSETLVGAIKSAIARRKRSEDEPK